MLAAMPDLEPSPDFCDRVMARVADLPLPTPVAVIPLHHHHRLDLLRTFLFGSLATCLAGGTIAYWAPAQFWSMAALLWYGLQATGSAVVGLWNSVAYLVDGLAGWAWQTPVLALCLVAGALVLEWQLLHRTAMVRRLAGGENA